MFTIGSYREPVNHDSDPEESANAEESEAFKVTQ